MRTRPVPTIALLAAVALLAGCGGSSKSQGALDTAPAGATTAPPATETVAPSTTEPAGRPAPSTTRVTIRVVGGRPRGGIARPELEKGANVVLVVSSDVADEVHLHGYDVSRPVAAGGVAQLPFVATIPGRFEVELEEHGVQIAELTVR